ncbi:hypothetical protein NEOKW01_1626 [Nematocida sp. AWRm80]|nr:hypothetical protein NEOKW01_1626 [Nematocida sp. AWRm80]
MAVSKYNTVSQRLETFKEWRQERPGKEDLAYAGFIWEPSKKSSDAVVCVWCDKSLEGWDPTDVPMVEHYQHQPMCTLSSLHQIQNRQETLTATLPDITVPTSLKLASNGIFSYNLVPEEKSFFCYMCGLWVTISANASMLGFASKSHILHSKLSPECRYARVKHSNPACPKPTLKEIQTMFYFKLLSNQIDLSSWKKYDLTKVQTKAALSKLLGIQSTDPRESLDLSESNISIDTISLSTLPKNTFPTAPALQENLLPSISTEPKDSSACTIRLSEVDPVVKDLLEYLTKEEAETLPIKEALFLGLQRLIAQTKQVIDKDIETLKEEIFLLIAQQNK